MKLALISKKGGVGKTTTTVNLAAGLARLGHRVLLVDLDSQASASLSVGLGRGSMAPGAADLLLGTSSAHEVVHATATPNLSIIPATPDLIHADFELGGYRAKERRLADRIAPLAGEFDFILFDCPPSLTLLPLNALVAADGFLVPVVPQYLAWEGVENLLSAAERITARAGTKTPLLGLLLTMVDYRLRLTRETVDALRSRYGPQVLAVEIRVNVRLSEAPAAGQPIFEFDPTATGAIAYELLTEEVLLRCGHGRPAAPVVPAPTTDSEPASEPVLTTEYEPPGEPR